MIEFPFFARSCPYLPTPFENGKLLNSIPFGCSGGFALCQLRVAELHFPDSIL